MLLRATISGAFKCATTAGGVQRAVTLLGFSREDDAVVELVDSEIEALRPDGVVLECCAERAKGLAPFVTDSSLPPLLQWMLGVRPPDEHRVVLAAWRAASRLGAAVVLGDLRWKYGSWSGATKFDVPAFQSEQQAFDRRLDAFVEGNGFVKQQTGRFLAEPQLAVRQGLVDEWSSYPDARWADVVAVHRPMACADGSEQQMQAMRDLLRRATPSAAQLNDSRALHLATRIADASPSLVQPVVVLSSLLLTPVLQHLHSFLVQQ